MKITRVKKISQHRVFRDFKWPNNLHEFGRFNLIYGWNGCGKTTLSSLFAHIENRKNVNEGEVEFEFDGSQRCKGDEIDKTALPLVRVFNRNFVEATITIAHEYVAPILYLGKESREKH
ncbi:MAG: AAA family ATPase, partial [Polyangiales bacterium]